MATSSPVRVPRLDIRANGAPLLGAFSVEIVNNNHLAADRFCIHAALASLPERPVYTDNPDLLIDIRIGLGDAPPTSLLQGEVDSVEFDPIANTVRLDGRDLSARLIEARTQETFANQTSSEIAATLAGRHALEADVQATTTPVGRYWQLEHDSITLDAHTRSRSEWDLLMNLAAHEGFDVWVSGSTLHFRPALPPSATAATLRTVSTLAGPPNVTSLRLDRALTLARDIEVTVKSWNNRQQAAFIQTARSTAGSGGAGGAGAGRGGAHRSGKRLNYAYVVPNLTADEAQKLAQRKLAEISAHERVIAADMPGDLALLPRMLVGIEGTGTGFDQVYVIDEVERRLDLHDGFTQRIRARTCNVS